MQPAGGTGGPVALVEVGEQALVRVESAGSAGALAIPFSAKELITLVIPAFNEEEGIGQVLEKVKAELGWAFAEILVIDDGSIDRTAEIAEGAGVKVIRHHVNRGYGASLKSGNRAATTTFVVTMDADGQHRIEDVARLCNVIADSPSCDLAIGHRTHLIHSPLWRMPGKWMLTRLAEFLVQQRIPDLNSGLRLMRRDIALKYINICPRGFSFSTTITMAFLSRGYYVSFVPIQVESRVGKSTVRLKTGFETIMLVLRLAALFNPLRIFLPASAVALLSGLGWGVPYVVRGEGVTVGAMLSILSGVLLFALGIISDQIAQLRLERYE